jgi:hypothetical protein
MESGAPFRHKWQFEPETGFVCTALNGRVDEEDAKEFIARYKRDVPPGEPCFMLADHRSAVQMTPGARRVFVSGWKPGDVYLAGFGMSFTFRAIANLLFKAMAIAMPQFVATIVADEATARTWLTEKKRNYVPRRAPGESE